MAAAPVPPIAPPAPEAAPLSQGARIINTFIAPSKTFTDLGAHAKWSSWIAPWVVASVIGILFAYAVGEKVTFAKAADNVMQTRPKQYEQIQAMKPEDRDQTMQKATQQTKTGSYAFPVVDIIILLVVTTALFASFTFILNAKVSFKLVLAIVAYAGLPGAIKFLLATITLFAGMDPDNFNVQNPLATNLGILFNAADHPVLYAAMSFIDIFAIWTLVLTAIGFTRVSKAKLGPALAIVFIWYVIFAAIPVGLVAAFS